MLRDKLRDEEYFNSAVENTNGQIDLYLGKIQTPEELVPHGRMAVPGGLVRNTLKQLTLCYSRGDAIESVQQELINLLKYRSLQAHYADALPEKDIKRRVNLERLTYTTYKNVLQWLSFAVALKCNQAYFSELLRLVDNPGLDALYDRIAIKLGDTERRVSTKVLYSKPYAQLLAVIDASITEQATLMSDFLEAWYPACVKLGDYETHTITNNFAYSGYWCFEAALIVNLFKIDDSSFRDHPHYPSDLVTYLK